ncbi:hypothetical protein Ac2012v2_000356 [Leucoagaricus gongylophorus]
MSSVKSAPHPLLVKYLAQLTAHPLRTKAFTTATLSFFQEVLASNFAGVPRPPVSSNVPFLFAFLSRAHIDLRAVKMAIYGFFISAPLNHTLVGQLQKAFSGKEGFKYKVAQLAANSLLVSPVTVSVYLASMAIINGAKSVDEIIKTIKAGFFSVIRISWVVSPISMFIAQKYVPVELWVPFFNTIQFVLGTYFNTRVKRMRLAAARKAKGNEKKDGPS